MVLKNHKGNLIGVGVIWIRNMNEYTLIIHGRMLKANELFAMTNSFDTLITDTVKEMTMGLMSVKKNTSV